VRFRKRPVVIEAIQFTDDADRITELSEWMGEVTVSYADPARPVVPIATLEGVMTAQVGDWIIKGVSGEFYPCKPEIFAATYEPA